MATRSLIFPLGTHPTVVQLLTLTGTPAASSSLPISFAGPVTLGDGRDEWTVTFSGAAFKYDFTATATMSGVPTPFVGVFIGDGTFASGVLTDQNTLADFLGDQSMAISSRQDEAATSPDAGRIQRLAINPGEARVFSRLTEWFAYPLTVSGVPIGSVTNSIALPLLRVTAHQFEGFNLNKWRAIQSVSNQESGSSEIDQVARGWEKDADANLALINRWAQGYSDGLAVDLDFAPGASRGRPSIKVQQPVFAGATVGRNGFPEFRIVSPELLPWWYSIQGLYPWPVVW